jgi:hypothetical protein
MMKQRQITLAKILTYSGTLPLAASAIGFYFAVNGFDSTLIARTYAAIIISFLCGIHWAAYLFFAEKCPRNLLITSNVIALLAWVSLLITHQPIAIVLQALCFLYMLTLDLKLRDVGIIPKWFYSLRRNATIIVVLCLSVIAGLS